MTKQIKLSVILACTFFAAAAPSIAAEFSAWRALHIIASIHAAPFSAVLPSQNQPRAEAVKTAWHALRERQAMPPARGAEDGGRRSASTGLKVPASRPSGVFGSVAIPFKSLPSAENWRSIQPAVAEGLALQCAQAGTCPMAQDKLARAMRAVPGKSFTETLSRINRAVNGAIAYVSDRNGYGQLDYWASPSQILAKGQGDCEDYAILKMAALKTAGIPDASMSIVVVKDRRRQVFHAVLSVSTNHGHFILDNLDDRVLLDTDIGNYLPLYSVSTDRSWIHGRKRGDMQVASASRLPDNLAPGEGIAHVATIDPIRK